MAVTLKRKPKGEPVVVPATLLPTMTKEEKEALEAVGLLPVSKTPEPNASTLKALSKGDKVIVAHGLYPWHKYYQKGDVGVVTGYWAAPDTPYTIRPDHDLCGVDFGEGRARATLQRWELELSDTSGTTTAG